MDRRWSLALLALLSHALVIAPAFAEHRELSPSDARERATDLVKLAPGRRHLRPTEPTGEFPVGPKVVASRSGSTRHRCRRECFTMEMLRQVFPAVVRALGRLGEADRTELLQGLFRMTDRARDELLGNLATDSAILEQVPRRAGRTIPRGVHDR